MEFLRFYMQEEKKDGFRPTVADTAFQHQWGHAICPEEEVKTL